ncbi:MAG TPA: response regulator transcription factor [Edaphocola sp.]|nr:response regulator transcription factor [Edaphocola sp.]
MNIKIVIVEDHKETREMLALLINDSFGYQCIAEFDNAESAIQKLPILKPDVVLMDIHLPGKSGIECIAKLKPIIPITEFIMCTLIEDSDSVFNALKAGASGYLSKSTAPDKIIDAIKDAKNGGSPMSSGIARKVVNFFQIEDKKSLELEKLTPREQEILQQLSKGYRYKEIADHLFIDIETVRKHIHNIYQKLQVSSRMDAINKVI